MKKGIPQKPTLTDDQIIRLFWERDEAAIRETDRKYGSFLFKIAEQILHDRMDCEECQNDTYLGAWNAIPPTKPTVLQAFLAQIMRRIAINRYKQKTSKKRIPSELTAALEDCEDLLESGDACLAENEAEEIGRLISAYVSGLNARQRYIFVGRYYMAESVESIADELELAVATVYRELTAIKRGLKLHLEENEVFI